MPSRREALQTLSALATLPCLPSFALGAPMLPNDDFDKLLDRTMSFFGQLGYRDIPSQSLLTSDTFNGGVRFDDTREIHPQGKWYSVQPASRVEDYKRGTETGVLAYFHIFSLYNSENSTFDGLLHQMLAYLTRDCRLDPTRIALISTRLFRPYLEALPQYGIKETQFIERDLDDAKELGDGSGFFNPKGVPHLNGGYPTVAFDYMLESGTSIKGKTYPLKGALELGEMKLAEDPKQTINPQFGGFGLERILLAMGKPGISYAESRQSALTAMKDQSEATGKALPNAYKKLANSKS